MYFIHPSRYKPRPTGVNFDEQTGIGVFHWVIAVQISTAVGRANKLQESLQVHPFETSHQATTFRKHAISTFLYNCECLSPQNALNKNFSNTLHCWCLFTCFVDSEVVNSDSCHESLDSDQCYFWYRFGNCLFRTSAGSPPLRIFSRTL